VLALAALASQGRAQCAQWDDRFFGFDADVLTLAVLDDGSGAALYAGGFFTTAGTASAAHIAKWNGAYWSPLGSGMNDYVDALAVWDDGTGPALYAGGNFTTAGGVPAPNIAKWNGTSWSALGAPGSGMDGNVNALIVFHDGAGFSLFAAGVFTTAGGVPAPSIAKWNGASWLGLGANNGGMYTLATFDDGSGPAMYAGGAFTTIAGVSASHVAKWNGTTWSALGSGISGSYVTALSVFDDGSGTALYAGGSFNTAGGTPASNVAKWNGASWSTLGTGMNGSVCALIAFNDGSGSALYAGGFFNTAGGAPALNIAKWNGASWSSLGAPGVGASWTVLALAAFDDGWGPALYVGGSFPTAGTVVGPYIAKWNGTTWTNVGAPPIGMDGEVDALVVYDDGSGSALYAGGGFNTAGDQAVRYVAKWNGTSWSALAGPAGGLNGRVCSFAVLDDASGHNLYAGGGFIVAGDIFAPHVARWNGTTWSAVGSGLTDYVFALAAFNDGSGAALYAGGFFYVFGGSYVAKWNGTVWSPVGAGFNDPVRAFAVFDDGTGSALYAGGEFTSSGSTSVPYVGKWNGTTWSAPGSGPNNGVDALASFDDDTGVALYAGGSFGSAGGVPAANIAKWNGTSWSALGAPGSGTNQEVLALTVFNDGSGPALYVGGYFTMAGGVAASHIAKWDGTSWLALGTGVGGPYTSVLALAAFDDGSDGDADLYAGGDFITAGDHVSLHFGEWHGCGTMEFCFGDGSTIPCPCANTGISHHGCDNSAATGGARLFPTGSATPDTLVLHAEGELPSALSIFLQGNAQFASPVFFGDGLRCIGGVLKRLYVKSSGPGTASAPESGDPSITARSAALGDTIAPGTSRYYQVYYRDPSLTFCPRPQGDTFNVGNALRVLW
jgi:hypothetical protein